MGLAGQAQGARRRRCGDIVDDEQRRDCPATPMRPKGSGGAWASAALARLDDATASPASRCLASARAALGTRHILILGQAPSSDLGTAWLSYSLKIEAAHTINSII
jgi:hypothetical protein